MGRFDTAATRYLQQHASVPVHFVDRPSQARSLDRALLFVSEAQQDFELDEALRATPHLQLVRERDLCARFGL